MATPATYIDFSKAELEAIFRWWLLQQPGMENYGNTSPNLPPELPGYESTRQANAQQAEVDLARRTTILVNAEDSKARANMIVAQMPQPAREQVIPNRVAEVANNEAQYNAGVEERAAAASLGYPDYKPAAAPTEYGTLSDRYSTVLAELLPKYPAIPEAVARAIIDSEGWNGIPSAAGARGPMQVMPDNLTTYGVPKSQWDDPKANIEVGLKMLNAGYAQYKDWDKAALNYYGPMALKDPTKKYYGVSGNDYLAKFHTALDAYSPTTTGRATGQPTTTTTPAAPTTVASDIPTLLADYQTKRGQLNALITSGADAFGPEATALVTDLDNILKQVNAMPTAAGATKLSKTQLEQQAGSTISDEDYKRYLLGFETKSTKSVSTTLIEARSQAEDFLGRALTKDEENGMVASVLGVTLPSKPQWKPGEYELQAAQEARLAAADRATIAANNRPYTEMTVAQQAAEDRLAATQAWKQQTDTLDRADKLDAERQRIKEAMANLGVSALGTVGNLGVQATSAFAQAAPSMIPQGMEYFPGRQPGGAMEYIQKAMGQQFTPTKAVGTNVNFGAPVQNVANALASFLQQAMSQTTSAPAAPTTSAPPTNALTPFLGGK